MRHALLIIAIVSITSVTFAQTTYPAVEQAKPRWVARLAESGGKAIVSEYYPTEESLVFLTAYDFTRDPRYAEQAAKQLEYAHGREMDGLFLTTSGTTTRDYQARQIYNFYVGYRTLADGRYIKWADACADAMVRVIPRRPHEHAGQTHTIFIGSFVRPDGSTAVENGETIDGNQNSEIALAFTLLYHDPASKWFLSPVAKEIADEELLAAMSIQDVKTGVLALTEHIPGGDTAYGSYAMFSWVWCQLLWKDPQFEPHLQAASKWLAPKTDLAQDSRRYYPTDTSGYIPYWEANYRTPLLWYTGVSPKPFIPALLERMNHPEATPGDTATAPLYWVYFDLMGMPRSYYLGAELHEKGAGDAPAPLD